MAPEIPLDRQRPAEYVFERRSRRSCRRCSAPKPRKSPSRPRQRRKASQRRGRCRRAAAINPGSCAGDHRRSLSMSPTSCAAIRAGLRFRTSGGRLRFRRVATGPDDRSRGARRAHPAKRAAIRLSMSTAPAPVCGAAAWPSPRRSAPAHPRPAMRPRMTLARRPAKRRSSVLRQGRVGDEAFRGRKTTSVPRTYILRCAIQESRPPQMPKLTTHALQGGRRVRQSWPARSGSSPQTVIASGLAVIAASRRNPLTIRTRGGGDEVVAIGFYNAEHSASRLLARLRFR